MLIDEKTYVPAELFGLLYSDSETVSIDGDTLLSILNNTYKKKEAARDMQAASFLFYLLRSIIFPIICPIPWLTYARPRYAITLPSMEES